MDQHDRKSNLEVSSDKWSFTLKLDINELKKESTLSASMLHYRGVVFPKVNDMIFRRRLILNNHDILKRTLENIQQKLISKFNDLYDFQNASLRRDMLLLFLTKKELESRISFEVKTLPKNQDPSYNETYSTILQLKKIQAKNPKINNSDFLVNTTPEIVRDRLCEQYDILESHKLPSVDMSWLSCKVLDGYGDKVGPAFVAKTEDDAEEFFEEISKSSEEDKKYQTLKTGMRALGFLNPDPILFEDSFIQDERYLIDSIFKMHTSDDTEGISLLQKVEMEEIKMNNLGTEDSIPDLLDSQELQ